MKAVGYIRVSTEQQADSGLGLEVQEAKVRAMAEVQSAELVELIVDAGESAKSLRRPGMERLLTMIDQRKVDSVIVYKLDRLTRSVQDLGALLDRFDRKGVSLVSVSESLDTATAAGRLVLNVMGSVAQWEREVIGERTKEAMHAKRAKGERISGELPFGYKLAEDGIHLEPHTEEQKTLELLQRLRSKGLSLRATAEQLNRKGHTTRAGSLWRHQYVANIVSGSTRA